MRRAARAFAAAAGGVLALAGCSSAAPTGSSPPAPSRAAAATTAGPHGVQRITIDATDMLRFDPMRITARPGTLRITLRDTGTYPHNIDFPSLHVLSSNVSGDPGSMSTTVTVHVPKPGRYRFECTYHSTAGMTGVLVVS